jgi:2,3-bisphosphoglycerate-dependent phosphoglycerate mutase
VRSALPWPLPSDGSNAPCHLVRAPEANGSSRNRIHECLVGVREPRPLAPGRDCAQFHTPAVLHDRSVDRLILVRHGESEYSARGLLNGDPRHRCRLTQTGRVQARRLGTFLRPERIDLCVTSEFERTIETADIALARRAIPRLVIPDLNDHPAGDFEGKAIADYIAWAHDAPSRALIPGTTESRLDVLRRFTRGYRTLLDRPEPAILAILHSLPISYLQSGPLQQLPLLDYATPAVVPAMEVLAGVERLEKWATNPTW